MALTWATLAVGVFVTFVLPFLVIWLNGKRRYAGWWLLGLLIGLIILGNGIEKLTTGKSAIF